MLKSLCVGYPRAVRYSLTVPTQCGQNGTGYNNLTLLRQNLITEVPRIST